MLMTILECEENYLFTNDNEYVSDNLHKYIDEGGKKKEDRSVDRGKYAVVQQLRKRINAYFFIVSRNLKDSIPKVIGTFLIQSMTKDLRFVLFNNISKANSFLSKMNEPSDLQAERERMQKQVTTLQKAERRIMSDPAYFMCDAGSEA